jgi:hypothetical protein
MGVDDEKELEKKSEAVRLMTSATGGGCGFGSIYILHEESIENVLKGDKIRNRRDNARPHNRLWFNFSSGEQLVRGGAEVRKSEVGKTADYVDVEHSITQRFRNVIGVYYLRMRRYLGMSYVNHINL